MTQQVDTASGAPRGDHPSAWLADAWSLPATLGIAWLQYCADTAQRAVLFADVLRQRGNAAAAAAERVAPNVLSFQWDLVVDGRTLGRPVNYGLLRITPPAGTLTDPAKRPFVVFDPRAGHGPGIGGMKRESEIGAALQAGHPCYFVGFTTRPVPGQTIEDVCRAEALFVRHVASLHPDAPGAPALIGNCQAGWQVMLMAAMEPATPGPILIAGAPLSYWAGNRGRAPLRYLGGLLGGTWLTALAGDLGAGIFDGAGLIANFEGMNPANTYFRKGYSVFDHVDTEAPRFLGFEAWWGSPVLLNAEEMQWIADNLFVGNRLAAGEVRLSDGVRIDLRDIRSPIVVFCSWGDDITPPPQALGWIVDMYDSVDDIVAAGQTIVYMVHPTIGHLGIFVSGKVASREHVEFTSCMDMIDLMPPGLYEAVIADVGPDTENLDLVEGKYLFRMEARTLEHIRALGHNSADDTMRFATAARVSEINNSLYSTLLRPAVRAMVTPESAETMRAANPHRLRYMAFADSNPLSHAVQEVADTVRANRLTAPDDNPFRQLEHAAAALIETALTTYGALRDIGRETVFLGVYGSPLLQAAVGMRPADAQAGRLGRSVGRDEAAAKLAMELIDQRRQGGPLAALLRSVNYIHRADREVDERAFAALAHLRGELALSEHLSFQTFKQALRTQALIVGQDPEAALATLPDLLPHDRAARAELMAAIRRVAHAAGALSPGTADRLARIEAIVAQPTEPAEQQLAAE